MQRDETFKEALNELNEEAESTAQRVYEHTDWIQQLARKRHDKKRGIQGLQFTMGKWVLLTMKVTPKYDNERKKIRHGPFKMIGVVEENVCKVNSLTGKNYVVHASRLWFYSTKHS